MMPEFADWETFYVIVGASAGALIGLQFVVLTLIAGGPSIRSVAEASAAKQGRGVQVCGTSVLTLSDSHIFFRCSNRAKIIAST
jgi:hypothetical protein